MTTETPIKVLSLGWGVQSFTLAAMSALGELEKFDLAIFADTHHENAGSYDLRDQFTGWLGERGVRVVTVEAKNTNLVGDWDDVRIPAYGVNKVTGHKFQIRRECTGDWKVDPVRAELRRELEDRGLKKSPGVVEMSLGISRDEWHRMKDSNVKWIQNKFPLIDRNMTRADCAAWLESHQLPLPEKSGCVFCPYMRNGYFKRMKQVGGTDWNHAVEIDREIRNLRTDYELFIHRSTEPLEQAVKIPEDFGARQPGFEECDSGFCWN